MTHDLLVLIWRGTFIASAAICLVLLLRLPMRRWFGAQAAYLLWALVPCALFAAMLPAPAHPLAAMLQVVPAAFTIPSTAAPIAMPAAPALDKQAWLLAIWCIGAVALLASLVWQQRRYLRALGGLIVDNDGALRAQGRAGSPALVGALRPRIVLPQDFDSRFDARERELVLAHERAHLARGDAQINALIALLRCLNWFNPLFHFAASLLRFDQELACDAHVINRFPEARRPYADAMLKAQLIGEARQELRLPIGCYWPSTHPLKERIAMLKSPILSPRRRLLASACVALLALSVGYASWASQPGGDAVSGTSAPAAASTQQHIGGRFVLSVDGVRVLDTLDGNSKAKPGDWKVEMDSDELYMSGSVAHVSFVPLVRNNGSFGVSATRGEERGRVTGVAKLTSAGTIDVVAQIEHNDEIVSKPHLVLRDGEPAAVQIGEDVAQNGAKGVRLDLTLQRTNESSAQNAPIAAQNNLALLGIHKPGTALAPAVAPDAPPTENVAFRKMFPPKYPAEAVRDSVSGKVMLKAHVDETGTPTSAEVVSVEPAGAAILANAAIASAMQWHYNPGMRDGKPVGGDVMVPVDFELSDMDGHALVPAPAASLQAPSYRRMRPPQYPANALSEKLVGTVWVRAHVNVEGAVTEAHAEQTYPLAASELADAAVGAIKTWTFNPAAVNGAPVEGDVVVPLHFAIDGYTPQANSEPVPAFPPQTPLLAMVTITGPRSCGKDCPPPPPAPAPAPSAATLPKPALPPQPVNAASTTPALFDIFPTEQHC